MTDSVISSLNRIEGQVRGVKKMYESGRDCEQLAQQISAIQKALTRVGMTLLMDEAVECVERRRNKKDIEKVMESLVKIA
jgi:DNA-binding FrmR family transcriptional regulator